MHYNIMDIHTYLHPIFTTPPKNVQKGSRRFTIIHDLCNTKYSKLSKKYLEWEYIDMVWLWMKSQFIFYLAIVIILFEIKLWKYVLMFRHCVNIAVSFMLLRIRKCLLLENAHLAYLRMIKVNVQHLICIKDVCVCMCVCQNIKYKHDKLFIKTRKPHAN